VFEPREHFGAHYRIIESESPHAVPLKGQPVNLKIDIVSDVV
jgi:hypothetical protein